MLHVQDMYTGCCAYIQYGFNTCTTEFRMFTSLIHVIVQYSFGKIISILKFTHNLKRNLFIITLEHVRHQK